MPRSFFTPIFILLASTAFVRMTNADVVPEIARYLGDRKGAVSLTFDDGFRKEAKDALATIDALGIKGTFFLIPTRMDDPRWKRNVVSWDEARLMQASGHEIGTHATVGVKLHEAGEADLDRIVNGAWQLLGEKLEDAPVSYALPGGSQLTEKVESKVREHHSFIRNSKTLPDAQTLGYGSAGRRKWEDHKTRARIETAIEQGVWVIPIIHSIVGGYSPFASKEEFREHCEWLKSKEHELWIAPMGVVARYAFARDAAIIKTVKQSDTSITISLTHDLENKVLFNHPLTVVVPVGGCKSAKISVPDSEPADATVKEGRIVFDLIPDGTEVVVSWTLH